MPIEVFVDEVPRERTVWETMFALPELRQAMKDVIPRKPRDGLLWALPAPLDLLRLQASYVSCLADVGQPRGFANREGVEGPYRSISLVYNPDHQDGLDPLFSTLGTPQNSINEFYALFRSNDQPQRKNSYWDTLGFRAIHPIIQQHFGWFIKQFSRTLVRSRIATIVHTEYKRISDPEFNWHIDETPFCNLRMNIPLFTAPQYLMEIDSEHVPMRYKGRMPSGHNLRWRGHLSSGGCYSWNTELPHRVFADGQPAVDRVHIVLGFSPWFDWDEAQRCWRANEQFGRVHPFDMLDQIIHPIAPPHERAH
jgi:hypothetical protein